MGTPTPVEARKPTKCECGAFLVSVREADGSRTSACAACEQLRLVEVVTQTFERVVPREASNG